MNYVEMLEELAKWPAAPPAAIAMSIPPSDPAHELAWMEVAATFQLRANAILQYVDSLTEQDT